MTITIDDKILELSSTKTILQAASECGIQIPTLCYCDDIDGNASCMICAVKEKNSGEIIPACSTIAENGMNIETESEEIKAYRKKILQLLVKEHRAECESPCVLACPAGYDIPTLHRYISKGMLKEAVLQIHLETKGEPLECIDCEAICEKACRRGSLDFNVSIKNIRIFLSQQETVYNMEDFEIVECESSDMFLSKLGDISKEELREWLNEYGSKGVKNQAIDGYLSSTSEAKLCIQCRCNAIDNCKLRQYATQYGIKDDGSKIKAVPIERKVSYEANLVFENAKCIKCGLCTSIVNDLDGRASLCIKNKGINIQVIESIGTKFDEIPQDKAQEYVNICPTGAFHKLLE